jgi:cytochrome P450
VNRDYPFPHDHLLRPPESFAKLRTHDPVARVTLPDGEQAWLVTRYEDVRRVLSDPRLVRDPVRLVGTARPPGTKEVSRRQDNRLEKTDHARWRRLVAGVFTARHIEGLGPRIAQSVHYLIDRMRAAGPPADLVAGFHFPLHIRAIGEVIGVPDDQFDTWANAFQHHDSNPGADLGRLRQEMESILLALLPERRRGEGRDLLSRLLEARDAEHGDLTDLELVRTTCDLMMSGYQSMANGLGMVMFALLCHPDQMAALRDDPRLTDSAVEEMLRYAPPLGTYGVVRYASVAVEFGGVRIAPGSAMIASIWSANRDPRLVADPDRFEVARRCENMHLGFGFGRHFCLGASLARLETRMAVRGLLDRLPGLSLDVAAAEVPWRVERTVAGPRRLPVTWTP